MTEILSRQQLVDAILPLLVDAGWQPLPAGAQTYVAVRGSWWLDFGYGSFNLDARDPEGYSAQIAGAEVGSVEQAVAYLRVAGVLPAVERLAFRELTDTNRQRCRRWHPGFPKDSWTGSDWSNAMAGEAGETANVVKKLRRAELNTRGALDPDVSVLVEKLGDEIADTVIYADLLAQYYGLDLAACVARKFNAVSVREGFPERLPGGAS